MESSCDISFTFSKVLYIVVIGLSSGIARCLEWRSGESNRGKDEAGSEVARRDLHKVSWQVEEVRGRIVAHRGFLQSSRNT